MKIALIVPGGVDRSGEYRVIPCLLWLIERLARRHDVHVVALRGEPEPCRYELLGATVHAMGSGKARWRALRCVMAEHRVAPFDVFHAMWAGAPGFVAAWAGWLLRRPVALHLGGGELVALQDIGYGGARTLRGRVQTRVALRGADRITAASAPMLDALAELGISARRVPLGVDLTRWPVREPERRGGTARLLHVASLNHVKDQRTLLQAAALLRDENVDFHLDVVGEDTLSGAVQALAVSLELDDRVTFHGFLRHVEARALFERAHLLLVSSRHEAGPLVVLEAAVAGVPTVGTSVGHVKDFAPDAAVAVPLRSHEGLARRIAELLADDARRLDLARAAQQRATREDADWTARRFEEIYEELVGNR
jgi:glycosyltransferase involved in cell wall biosynthesis